MHVEIWDDRNGNPGSKVAAVGDAVVGGVAVTRGLVVVLLVLAVPTVVGHVLAILSSAKLRARYAQAALEQRAAIAASIRQAGADHLVLRTDRDWLTDLIRFVSLRRERAARLPRRTR